MHIEITMSLTLLSISLCLLAQSPTTRPVGEPTTRPVPDKAAVYDQPIRERESIDQSIADGLKYLAASQQADGSWGTGLSTRGTEVYSSVPGCTREPKV